MVCDDVCNAGSWQKGAGGDKKNCSARLQQDESGTDLGGVKVRLLAMRIFASKISMDDLSVDTTCKI